MSAPIPPPMPAITKQLNDASINEESFPFTARGTTAEDTTFEFHTTSPDSTSVPLKTIVRQYVGSQSLKNVPATQLHLIIGRLRCMKYMLDKYNEGIKTQSLSFRTYWRQRTLNQLSGFGFHVQNPSDPISVVGLPELIDAVEKRFAVEINDARELIKNGLITFDALNELYQPGVPIEGRVGLGGTPGIFMLTEYYYEERRSLLGMEKSFHWSMEFVATMGEHFSVVGFTEVLSGWTGVRARPLSELTYTPILDSSEVEKLKQRGERYSKFGAGGSQFIAYAPNTFFIHRNPRANNSTLSGSKSTLMLGGGRIMIDPSRGAALGHHASQGHDEPSNAMTQQAGRYRRWLNTNLGKSSASHDGMILWDTVPDEFQVYCWPALVGFSFSAKAWGHVLVSGLEAIEFYDKAFDQLVISEDRKQLIRALIRFGGEHSADIIGGKSGGTIILLHGPPGVGKTLTAEAIAEVLHRPLYYVTMGELGMQPQEMEERLSDVLDLCAGWNALTLLDEADIFLEMRNSSDLVRNALVCVMLRLLEYHPGILFLTTNRVKTFDPAVESRITVALRYDALAVDAREQIWKNLLERAGRSVSTDVSCSDLAKHDLNGRQIKNAVRLAVALACERQTDITPSVLDATMQVTNVGRQEMASSDYWKGD